MLIINIYGAPGAGKSTTSAGLFSVLKDRGEKVSLISESATDLIESGQGYMLKDFEYQPYVVAMQFRKIKDQERLGSTYLISDSPILLQLNYIKDHWLHDPMFDIYEKLMRQYTTFDVLVLRGKAYSTYKRIHTDEQSMDIQAELMKSRPYHITVPGRNSEIGAIVKELDDFVKRHYNP